MEHEIDKSKTNDVTGCLECDLAKNPKGHEIIKKHFANPCELCPFSRPRREEK